jgi:hypothetical protein
MVLILHKLSPKWRLRQGKHGYDGKSDLPTPGRVNGRLYFDRHAVENFKRQLVGLGPVERNPREPITFIDATTVANELGVCRRTVSRLITGRFRGEAA